MSKRKDGQTCGKHALEFKLEAARRVMGGHPVSVTSKIPGVPVQTLGKWVRLGKKGQRKEAGDKPVSPEQMELARLRAELAPVKMERGIQKMRRRTSPWNPCEVRLDYQARGPLVHHAGLRDAGCQRQRPLRALAQKAFGQAKPDADEQVHQQRSGEPGQRQ